MAIIQIITKRTRTRQREGYMIVNWVSSSCPGGFSRLQTTYLWPKGQKTKRGHLDAR